VKHSLNLLINFTLVTYIVLLLVIYLHFVFLSIPTDTSKQKEEP